MGYDAGYYGYLWSEAYSYDIFSLFPQENNLDKKALEKAVGMNIRKSLLETGATKDGMDMLVNCLNRQPSLQSYLSALKSYMI